MTRFTVLLFLTFALTLGSCKKGGAAGGKNTGGLATASPAAVAADSDGGRAPAAPEKPDFGNAPAVPAAVGSPAAPKAAAAGSGKPVIDTSASAIALCYHNIEDNSKMKALTITVAEFEKEMKEIKDAGFTVIPMQDFIAWRRGEKSIPKKSCIISIDDGWLSGYTNAWPILKKYGYPFTMFIYIQYVGSGGKSLTWDQLAEMRDAGVDIECHTYSHSSLHGKGTVTKAAQKEIATIGYDAWLHKEIVESKQVLQQQLGIKVNSFAYPYGVYNAKAREVVKEAGYEAAFTVYGQRLTHSSPADLLGRYAVEAGKPKIFQDALAMIGGGVSAAEAASAPNVAQLAAASMVTQPLNGETITNTSPLIKANLATMGEIEPGSLEVRLSGVGPLTPQFNAETKMLTAQVTQKLKPDSYTVIVAAKVNGQRAETRWSFNVGQTASSALSATPAPAAPVSDAAPASPAAKPAPKPKKK